MALQVINGVGIAGIRAGSSSQSGGNTPSFDTDAQSFITAASITATTQQNAVNDLVLDLKAAGLWTKMKTLYPMVGGTSSSHKFNLINPADTNEAYRLTFNGVWTHTSSGATPNGGYANTYITPSLHLLSDSSSLFIYTPNPKNGTAGGSATTDFGSQNGSAARANLQTSNLSFAFRINFAGGINSTAGAYAFYHAQRNGTEESVWADGTSRVTRTTTPGTMPTVPLTLGAVNNNGNISNYSTKTYSFAGVGDGLTNLESNLFYQIVEKFQYALGRNVNASQPFYFNRNYSNEVNAFIFNGGITDATQISATNTLVNTLKTAGIWSKMKALYPFVGGTATAHKFNLVNPVDAASAYALTFNGGWTHSSTGALPNGSNSFADSWFNPRNNATLYNQHLSYYSRTQTATATNTDMGAFQNAAPNVYVNSLASLRSDGISVANINANDTTRITYSETDASGLFVVSRTANNSLKYYKNAIIKGTNTTTTTLINPNFQITLGALNLDGGATQYSNKQCAFASIGDGLTDAEATTFYNAVQAFQTTLGRQV
jgi:hypothetical protein